MLTLRAGPPPAEGDRGVSGPLRGCGRRSWRSVRRSGRPCSSSSSMSATSERPRCRARTRGSRSGGRSSGTRWWPRRSWIGSSTTATSWVSWGTATGCAGARTWRGHCIRPRREEPRPTIRRGRGGHLVRRRARLPRNSGRSAPDARSPGGKRARGSLHGPSGGPLGKASPESRECHIFESHLFPLFEAH